MPQAENAPLQMEDKGEMFLDTIQGTISSQPLPKKTCQARTLTIFGPFIFHKEKPKASEQTRLLGFTIEGY